MNVNFFRYILLITIFLMLVFSSGCAPSESDLAAPNAAFDGGVESPTNLTYTTKPISGTMDPGSIVSVSVSSLTSISATVDGLTQDTVAGTWSFTLNNMSEGVNLVQVSVADAVGNTRSINLSIVVDLTGPITTIEQYVTPTPNVNQVIAGTVNEIAAGVEFCIDDGITKCDPLEPLDWTAVDDVNGKIWKKALSLPVDGVYDILVRGFDVLGNRTAEASYAVKTLEVNSLAPNFSINETTPFYLPDPITVADGSLSGTRQVSYDLTLSNSPAVVHSLYTTSDTPNWTLDYTGLSSGNTVSTFTVDNGSGTDTAEASVLIVRDLIWPQLIVREPLPGTSAVPTTSDLVLTFSETMDPLTIDGTILTVEDEVGGAITFSVLPAVSPYRTYTFTPDSPLLASTRYTVQVFSTDLLTITDQFGNAFVPSNSTTPWVFTTAP